MARQTPGIACGDQVVSWSQFVLLHRLVLRGTISSNRFPNAVSVVGDRFNMIAILETLRAGVTENDETRMLLNRALGFTGYFEATDPRDMIYALIGMGREQERNSIVPDYNKPLEQVYTDAMTYLVHSKTGLNILSMVYHNHRNRTLPSWVPDFAMPHDSRLQPLMLINEFSASGMSSPHTCVTDNGRLLQVRGLRVDTIAKTCAPKRGPVWEDLPIIEAFAFMTLEQLMTPEAAQAVIQEDGAIWRTQVANREHTGGKPVFPASKQFGEIYQVLMRRKTLNEVDPDFEAALPPVDRFRLFRKSFEIAWLSVFACTPSEPGRCFFVTEGGRLGVGPVGAQQGDQICVLYGAAMLSVLRPTEERYELIGESYVHGIMHGEALGLGLEDVEFCIQ